MLSGVDVYSGSNITDWSVLTKAGYQFALIKTSEGTYYRNPIAQQQTAGAREVGMAVGFYHYGRPSMSSGHDEARFFLDTLTNQIGGLQPGDLLALDLEDEDVPDGADLLAYSLDFLQTVEKTVGFRPLFYSGAWYMSGHNLWNQSSLGAYPLWYAAYQPDPPTPPPGWSKVTIWQSGVDLVGDLILDRDQFEGSLDDLRKLGKPGDAPHFLVGPGFQQLLANHPEYGQPVQSEWHDGAGNSYLWTDQGVLLVWRKALNEARALVF